MDEADCMLKTTKVMGHVTREPCPPPPPPESRSLCPDGSAVDIDEFEAWRISI